jgi:hypothetical protein
MKAIAKANFLANGVSGLKDKQLSEQEIQKLGPLLNELVEQKLIETDQKAIQLEEKEKQSHESSMLSSEMLNVDEVDSKKKKK